MKPEFFGVSPLIQVFDMPTAVRFYRDVLGFELLNQSQEGTDDFDWCLLSRAGAELMLNTMYEREHRPAKPNPQRTVAHDDTCLYFACRDLDAAYQHLQAHGVHLKPPGTAPYGMHQLYFHDPDGYNICFQWPADERWAAQWRARYNLPDL